MTQYARKPARVLAVDDEPVALQVYKSILVPTRHTSVTEDETTDRTPNARQKELTQPDGAVFELVTCRQADEAVERVRTAVAEGDPFAVALLDVRLPPGRDGIWAAEKIRAADPDIELVIVTAFSDIDPVEIARRVPPVDKLLYMQKPFLPQEIRHFAAALSTKWAVARELKETRRELEALIETRTAELLETSINLKTDKAERKRAEEERKRLATAIEQAAEIVIIADTEGAIQYVNPAFERITGYAREEAIGQNPRILKSGKHDAAFYRVLWDTLTGGATWAGHFHNKKKDGSFYEEEATISPVRDAAGRIVNYVAVKRDVTHEAQLEAQLRHAQKMEALGALAGGIAHDFNNILQIVLGYADMAMADVPKDSAVYSLLKEVFTAGRRATDLVQQILTFSRQAEHERKPVRLQPAVKEALKLLRASLPTTIEIRQNIDPACGPVLADPTQIHQVVMNLCANAYHAMREQGGLLTVTLDEIEVDAGFAPEFPNLEQCRCAKLCVADTGPGMDETTRARIFDPYFTTKQPGEGTGLGLSTVHGIVRSHEGAITVHTQPGNGAAFCVFLPIHTGAASATDEETAHRLFPRGVERILLIDDEEQVLELQKKLLERLGYAVKARTSSVEAFEAFRAAPDNFDLVITDQTMPYLTGDQLAKRILAIRPGMPIILCTGFSETLTDERAKAIGVREYIHKPIIAHEVAVCVRRVLDNALAAKAPDAEKSP